MSEPATEIQTASADRLVIRIKLVAQEEPTPLPPPAPRLGKSVPLLIAGVVVVLLVGWFGIGSLRSDPPPTLTEKAPVTAAAPLPKPAPAVAPEVKQQPDAPLSAINEVVPDVPKSALDTIRGTIRVVIRVSIDKQGSVVGATADEAGPSRYFERLSRQAAKQWTFTPATLADQRTRLIRFNFTRDGAKAHLSDGE